MIIFGGATSSTNCLNDLWILDDANSADGTPELDQPDRIRHSTSAARMNHVAVYDSYGQNTAIIFGGANLLLRLSLRRVGLD
jgi:uncharacterized protein YaeQ